MKKTLLLLAAALTFGFGANAQTIFSEDFQSGSMPAGWTTIADDLVNANNNQVNYSGYNQSWQVAQITQAGDYAAVSISYTDPMGNDCDRWLITPAINITSTGYSLMADIWGYTASYPEKVRVMISTTGTEKTDFTEVLDVVMDGSHYNSGWNTILVNLDNYAEQNIHIAFVNHGDGFYTFVDNVQVKVIPANDMSAVSASAPTWTAQGSYIPVSLTVHNDGSAPLTSFDVTYTVNGGSDQNFTANGFSVAPFENYTYTFNATAEALGENIVNITVSNPNNDADVLIVNNSASCATTVYDPATTAQRNTVLEHFTTARCPNCPSGHERLESAIQGRENRVIWIAHHVGYYTDDMTINESNQMLQFFNDGGSTYAPASMLDRDIANATSEDPGPVFFPDSDVRDVITNAISSPAFVTVNITDVNYEPQSRQLSLTVSGSFASDMTFDSPRLSVYIMQDDIWGTQSGYSGKYQHNHVIRGCITDVWGDATAITNTTAGSTFSKTYTYTLPTKFNAKNCWVAAFVSNYDASNVNNRRIANGAKTTYILNGEDPTTGIGDVENSLSVTTYPNPATEMAYVTAEGTIRSYQMVDAMGRQVMAQENVNADILELNVSNFTAGVYFISVTTDRGVATQRLTIVK